MDEFERRLSASMKNAAAHPVDGDVAGVGSRRWLVTGGVAAVLVAAVIVSVYVATGGSPQRVEPSVGSPSPSTYQTPTDASDTALSGTWRVITLLGPDGRSELTGPLADKMHVTFKAGVLTGTTGCNDFGGRYTQAGALGSDISIRVIDMTARLCGTTSDGVGPVGNSEPPLVMRLQDARHVNGSRDVRRLYSADDSLIVELQSLDESLRCPEELAQASDETHGLGPEVPAAEAPKLPAPDAAVVCVYGAVDVEHSAQGAVYHWAFDGTPLLLSPSQLHSIASGLSQLRPPTRPQPKSAAAEPLVICTSELSGRYLILYRSGDRTVGVVVDNFGCHDIRLTSDPKAVVPGTDSTLVTGVLRGPDSLIDDLRRLPHAF